LGKIKVDLYNGYIYLMMNLTKEIFEGAIYVLWIILFLLSIFGAIKTVNSSDMSVSVIIPAFNEAKTVGHVVKTVKR